MNINSKRGSKLFCLFFIAAVAIVLSISATEVNAGQITVNTFTDEYGTGADCSLREAIQAANNGADFGGCVHVPRTEVPSDETQYVHEIILPAGEYELTRSCSSEYAYDDNNVNGDLDVRSPLIVRGADANTTVISGKCISADTKPERAFHLRPAFGATERLNAKIENVTIQKGYVVYEGGGIFVDLNADLVMNNVKVLNNHAHSKGGGIYVAAGGTLELNNVTVENNEADRGSGIGSGGGVYSYGTVTINSSDVSNNHAAGSGGGIFNGTLAAGAGPEIRSLYVVSSTIAKNEAQVKGGGLYNEIHNALFSYVTVTKNEAPSGGGVYVNGGRFEIGSSIMAENTPANCKGNIITDGYNVLGPFTADCTRTLAAENTPNDQLDVANTLLGENVTAGGSLYYMPLIGSLAVGLVLELEQCPETDQRGFDRGSSACGGGLRCDSGSVQVCCGDGLVGGSEVCDSGVSNGTTNSCNATCSGVVVAPDVPDVPDVPDAPDAPPECGNGVIEDGEICDDGNTIDDATCSADCSRVPAVTPPAEESPRDTTTEDPDGGTDGLTPGGGTTGTTPAAGGAGGCSLIIRR